MGHDDSDVIRHFKTQTEALDFRSVDWLLELVLRKLFRTQDEYR